MAGAKFTEGPFVSSRMTMSRAAFSDLHDKDGFDIVQRGQDVVAITWADDDIEQAANARLFAAAPDLLAALRLMDERLRECMANPSISAADAYDSFYQQEVAAAIAKATGAA